MRTMHSVLKHGGLFWDRAVVSGEGCEQRFNRLQQAVVASGDEAWLIFGDVERHGNITYASNFLPRVRSALVFVPREGAPILLANIGLRDVPAAKTITWIEEVRPFGRLPKELVGLIEEKRMQVARIGTCGFDDRLPVAEWEAIDKALPQVTWTSRDAEIDKLRAGKADWEIATMRRSAEIANAALGMAPEVLRPDSTVREAIAAIDRHARRSGVEDTHYLVSTGGQTLRLVDDRILAAGDVLTLYMSVEYQRYWAETARTFVLGTATPQLRALHERAARSLAAMQAVTRAGVSATALAEAARGALADDGLYRVAEGYGLGHGIGLDDEEGAQISLAGSERVAENATMATRVILQSGGTSVGVSHMLVARRGGNEPIDTMAPLNEIRV